MRRNIPAPVTQAYLEGSFPQRGSAMSAPIDATFLRRCHGTLDHALSALQHHDADDIEYDVFRAACVKEFELVLEQSGKLLKKRLKPYFSSSRQVDRLVFKDVFRHAAKHGLINAEACERWLEYRDNGNETAHDYAEILAEATLALLPAFLADARALADRLEEPQGGRPRLGPPARDVPQGDRAELRCAHRGRPGSIVGIRMERRP